MPERYCRVFTRDFAGGKKGMGSTLFPAGAQIREVRVFFPSGEVLYTGHGRAGAR